MATKTETEIQTLARDVRYEAADEYCYNEGVNDDAWAEQTNTVLRREEYDALDEEDREALTTEIYEQDCSEGRPVMFAVYRDGAPVLRVEDAAKALVVALERDGTPPAYVLDVLSETAEVVRKTLLDIPYGVC